MLKLTSAHPLNNIYIDLLSQSGFNPIPIVISDIAIVAIISVAANVLIITRRRRLGWLLLNLFSYNLNVLQYSNIPGRARLEHVFFCAFKRLSINSLISSIVGLGFLSAIIDYSLFKITFPVVLYKVLGSFQS